MSEELRPEAGETENANEIAMETEVENAAETASAPVSAAETVPGPETYYQPDAHPSLLDPSLKLLPATPKHVRAISALVEPYARRRILISKELINYFEDVQEFLVVVDASGQVVGCGALHVLWEDIAEVRTLAVHPDYLHAKVGASLLLALIERARNLGLKRVFCLTFEIDFFEKFGFNRIEGTPVGVDEYAEMLRSHDDGMAEFLDLARAKPNTLGNYRMLLDL